MAGLYRKKAQGKHHRTQDGSPRPARFLPLHSPLSSGRHRKPGLSPLTWRTAGGVLLSAAVLGTAAATAQASALPLGAVPTSMAAAESVMGKKDGAGAAGNDSSKDESKRPAKAAAKGSSRNGAEQGGGSEPGGGPAKEQPSEDSRPTAEDAIRVATSKVGVREDGRGETMFQQWYVNSPRAKETVARDGGHVNAYRAAPWCDMFISWVGEQLDFTDQIGSDAWTVTHARWFQEQGRWGTEPKPGAIVFFAWNGRKKISDIVHVGMVIKKVDDGTVQTVEGNTENAVKIKNRSARTIVGYGYPDYRS